MYIEAMVAPVKSASKDEYVATSQAMAKLFKQHGALAYCECWGSDVPDGKRTSFPLAVALEKDETCAICFITYPDKATRDSCMEAVMSDPEAEAMFQSLPLDGARMIFGGFETVVSA
ncbi:DUF1428 domain-containing protein [Oceaniovalibus sp. ACAM 378]|jgi:uncharacterized protein YbaA (DUF1428 family)|uniref:DUF1428 domain-containing protein n=1 Tax=Oceaniovalibus sp. ACAM 378 TaxID=2599923 RepID=UPI0011D4F1E0|nr:DUF1428 domain-containing protein [Oceaniovalibus sp. ACAM 378]TYB89265.1 DUF1428 domain-containing protein [Oceaniovalibus sp. ACAM 378]